MDSGIGEVLFFFLVFIVIGVTGTIGLKRVPANLEKVKRAFSRGEQDSK